MLSGRSRRLAILFGFAALSKQFIAGPLIFWDRPLPEQPWLELWFTLGSLGIPLAYALFVVLAAWLKPGWNLRVDTQAHLTSFDIALSRVEKRGVDWIHQSLANLGGWVQQRRGRLSR